NGNEQWYAGDGNTFFWSGACGNFTPASGPPPGAAVLGVQRRPDGTILPLSEGELNATDGQLDYTEGFGGRIKLKPAWGQAHIADFPVPSLSPIGAGTLTLNKKAAASFQRAFKAVDDAGLTARIIKSDGTFVPRHKGWDPTRGISSHSWGVTIDINAPWNPYGHD